MTPEQAQVLADHAATTWPDVLPNVWAARLLSYEHAEARAALAALRTRGGAVTLADLDREVTERRARRAGPCARCGGSGWITTYEPSRVVFAVDTTERPATVIPEPAIDEGADRAAVARAWAAAIRAGREQGQVETRTRTVAITGWCPECRTITPMEPA